MATKKYDSTVARIAGNLLSGAFCRSNWPQTREALELVAEQAVRVARAIVAEVSRTEPQEPT